MVRVSTPPPYCTHNIILEPALGEVVCKTSPPNGISIAAILATALQLVAIQPGQTAIADTQPATIHIGGKAVYLPAPTEFYSIGELFPDIMRGIEETMVPPQNRLLEVFVSESDLGQLMIGQTPDLERYMLVQVYKPTESIDLSTSQFSQFAREFKHQQDSFLSGVRDQISDLLDQTSDKRSEDYGVESQITMGEQVSLGVFTEADNSIGVANLTKYNVSTDNQQTDHVVAGSSVFVHVQNRLIYVYVYSIYQGSGDLDWVRSTSSDWIHKISAANFEQQSRVPASGSTGLSSFDWSRVIEKGAAGAIVGGILGLLVAVAHGIKKLFGKGKNRNA